MVELNCLWCASGLAVERCDKDCALDPLELTTGLGIALGRVVLRFFILSGEISKSKTSLARNTTVSNSIFRTIALAKLEH